MLTQSQISESLVEHGQPSYRATQILDWIFKKRAKSWDKMTNLPESLRVDLAEQYPLRPLIHTLTKGSEDTTRKYLMELADAHKLIVVEDAAQALNASCSNQALGTIGNLGAFSFHQTKNYSCGEGGALCINDESLIERAEIIREKGTNRSQFLKGHEIYLGGSWILLFTK